MRLDHRLCDCSKIANECNRAPKISYSCCLLAYKFSSFKFYAACKVEQDLQQGASNEHLKLLYVREMLEKFWISKDSMNCLIVLLSLIKGFYKLDKNYQERPGSDCRLSIKSWLWFEGWNITASCYNWFGYLYIFNANSVTKCNREKVRWRWSVIRLQIRPALSWWLIESVNAWWQADAA